MKISLDQTSFFDRKDFNGKIYIGAENNKGFNALLLECLTRHYKTRLKNAVRVYLVLEGSGTFTINEQIYQVEQYDLFVISDGDTYEYQGQMKFFEFNIPTTDSSNEDKLE